MITGQINLTKLVSALTSRKGKDGKMIEGVFIPIDHNHLFKSDKGNVYMNIIAFDLKEVKDDGDTHLVKISLPKDVREKMSKEDQNEMPIIGNLKVWGDASGREDSVNAIGDDDDLPF